VPAVGPSGGARAGAAKPQPGGTKGAAVHPAVHPAAPAQAVKGVKGGKGTGTAAAEASPATNLGAGPGDKAEKVSSLAIRTVLYMPASWSQLAYCAV